MLLTLMPGPVIAQQAEEWLHIVTGRNYVVYGRYSSQRPERGDLLRIVSRPGDGEPSYVEERIHYDADCEAWMVAAGDFTITSIPDGEVIRSGTYAGTARGEMTTHPREPSAHLMNWLCSDMSSGDYPPLSYSDAVDVSVFLLSLRDH